MRIVDSLLNYGIMREQRERYPNRRNLDMARAQQMLRMKLSGTTYWEGGQRIKLTTKVTEGPQHIVGRYATISISFEEIESLYRKFKEASLELAKQNAKVEAINKANQSEG